MAGDCTVAAIYRAVQSPETSAGSKHTVAIDFIRKHPKTEDTHTHIISHYHISPKNWGINRNSMRYYQHLSASVQASVSGIEVKEALGTSTKHFLETADAFSDLGRRQTHQEGEGKSMFGKKKQVLDSSYD